MGPGQATRGPLFLADEARTGSGTSAASDAQCDWWHRLDLLAGLVLATALFLGPQLQIFFRNAPDVDFSVYPDSLWDKNER